MFDLLDADRESLATYVESLGEKRFRATQLFRAIHQQGVADVQQVSGLAKTLRAKLAGQAQLQALPIIDEHVSRDGTIKWLFDVGGGDAVETVFIPEDDRGTLCVSSQAGCAVGLPLLLDRAPGVQPQPRRRARSWPSFGTPNTHCAGVSGFLLGNGRSTTS